MRYEESVGQFVPDRLPGGRVRVRTGQRRVRLRAQGADGRRAGQAAASHAGFGAAAPVRIEGETSVSSTPGRSFRIRSARTSWTSDEGPAAAGSRERGAAGGFDSVELLKRYSTLGMGPSQGSTPT